MNSKKRIDLRLVMLFILNILVNAVVFHHQVVAQDKKIVLATDPWPPFYGPDIKNGGYLTEIVKESFKRVGYDCKVEFVPWKRAVDEAKKGKYDGLLGAFYTEDRLKDFKYSEPVTESQLVFFSKKGRDIPYKKLEDLSQYKIGVIGGYQYSEEFDAAEYLYKEEVPKVEQNIKKVIADRIDIFIDSKEVVLYLLRTTLSDYSGLLEMIDPPYKINQLYIPISKKVTNYEQIVHDFNRGLSMIREDGTYDNIMKNRGF